MLSDLVVANGNAVPSALMGTTSTDESTRELIVLWVDRLVHEYGYRRESIVVGAHSFTSDHHTVLQAMDIACFHGSSSEMGLLRLIVDCHSPDRATGIQNIQRVMMATSALLGVWTNGLDHAYVGKSAHTGGPDIYEELPSIPRAGQSISEIGFLRRRDLVPPSNLKMMFRDFRNHLAGNAKGFTRDEALAQEILNLLFCKVHDEVSTPPGSIVSFRYVFGEGHDEVKGRVAEIFDKVKSQYSEVFEPDESLRLDSANIAYVVGEMQNYSLTEADRDAIGDAFETFAGPALRGAEGQFFTPRNVVQMMLRMLDPSPGELILDPACGSGGFIITALDHVWRKIETKAELEDWSEQRLASEKARVAEKCIFGIDKDTFLTRVARAYLAIISGGGGHVFNENSLLPASEWSADAQRMIPLGSVDVIFTNPPFGAKIPVKGVDTLSQFDLAYKWNRDKSEGDFVRSSKLESSRPPQVLFLERCLQFLKPGGKLGIVLPESMLGNPSYAYVIAWLFRQARILAVVSMPEALFKTSGKGGTHTKASVILLEKLVESSDNDSEIFFADAKWCGHDSRGNPTIRKDSEGVDILLDDLPTVAERYLARTSREFTRHQDHLGYLKAAKLLQDRILVPRYYDPEVDRELGALNQSHKLVQIGDLVERGLLSIATGVEVGKMAYGTGQVPFIRTSDISNWEIKSDAKHGVSEEIFEMQRKKAEARAGDILMVRDGTYLIGTSAILTRFDTRILFQSHIFRLRVTEDSELSPWLLFACLNAPVVKRQIRAKRFTQDIIDTLGNRILELVLPFPQDAAKAHAIAQATQRIVEERASLREEARHLVLEVQGLSKLDYETTDDLLLLD